jgi:hypothetical protein
MTINLDTEIVATHYDPIARRNYYTIERDDRRWTVSLHDDDLAPHGGNMQARRNHLGNMLATAMLGKADGE